MRMKSALLRHSAIVCAAIVASTATVKAAEVKPLGALDIGVGGYSNWYSIFGNIGNKAGGGKNGTYDFFTDNEIYIYPTYKDANTGLEYGAVVQLESDTNTNNNADETYVFVKGKFGEVRVGDGNGVVEQMVTGAQPLNSFTGGLDGIGSADDQGVLAFGTNTSDATKLVYYSPSFSGFQLGVSLTPSTNSGGQDIKTTNDEGDVQDVVEGGLAYTNQFGALGIKTSVTGAVGRFSSDDGRSRDYNQIAGGIDLSLYGVTFGGAIGHTKGARPFSTAAGDDGDLNDGGYIGTFVFEPGAKQTFYNLGATTDVGPVNLSLVYGQVISSSVGDPNGTPNGRDPEPLAVYGAASVPVAPGLTVGTEVGYFNNRDNTSDNGGVFGIGGVQLAF
ncbi:porin [Arboricoccus pini]|uniref:Porin n=1 Tax=Arboricoccus pini TaxID=1963835 RepID=A0A212PXY8_9PROT|nr:porin [Arboricoccus pini]SNB51912.1 porin [Arboricoccus pini]